MQKFQGNGCAEGIARGKVLIKKEFCPVFSVMPVDDVEKELRLLDGSVHTLKEQLEVAYEKTLQESGEEAAELIETYRMILLDENFFDEIRGNIRTKKLACITAINQVCERWKDEFFAMEDAYMRERWNDIRSVCQSLIMLACNVPGGLTGIRFQEPTCVVADVLTPVDTMKLDKKYLCGFVTENGGTTSHAVILARTLGIPAIVGVEEITDKIENDVDIIVNGNDGEIVIQPDEETLQRYESMIYKLDEQNHLFEQEPQGDVYTKDGQRIFIEVNSGDLDTTAMLDSQRNDGVGLFRTEFLYMNQEDYPDEETLFGLYRDAVKKVEGKNFVFRTLDIGGEKALDYMELPDEENPFLGYRAVRICLQRPELFRTQLRAILRASAYGNVQIMIPMITCVEEVVKCRELIAECIEELKKEEIPVKEDIEVGIMVETPASVLILDRLAAYVDFFSIGTNDLVQYIMAADRGNPNVQNLYDPFQIPVLRAIHHIGKVAKAHHIPVCVCGETAAMLPMVPFLVGCGVEKLSMAAAATPKLRYFVRRIARKECETLANEVVCMFSKEKVKEKLQQFSDEVMERTV